VSKQRSRHPKHSDVPLYLVSEQEDLHEVDPVVLGVRKLLHKPVKCSALYLAVWLNFQRLLHNTFIIPAEALA